MALFLSRFFFTIKKKQRCQAAHIYEQRQEHVLGVFIILRMNGKN